MNTGVEGGRNGRVVCREQDRAMVRRRRDSVTAGTCPRRRKGGKLHHLFRSGERLCHAGPSLASEPIWKLSDDARAVQLSGFDRACRRLSRAGA